MRLPMENLLAGGVAIAVAALMLAVAFNLHGQPGIGNAVAMRIPPPAAMQAPAEAPARSETAVFAAGCFWGVQGVFQHVKGVQSAVSGYIGGSAATARYPLIGTGRTGHAEAVQVTYDPARISYGQLVRRFLRTIDPTDSGGQFCDRGPSYRTAIFALNPAQRREALAAVDEANRILRGRVVTPVRAAAPFYAVEAYHQDYARRNPAAYNRYRVGCGKDARLRQIWGAQAATH